MSKENGKLKKEEMKSLKLLQPVKMSHPSLGWWKLFRKDFVILGKLSLRNLTITELQFKKIKMKIKMLRWKMKMVRKNKMM